jgi:hypothetical protein
MDKQVKCGAVSEVNSGEYHSKPTFYSFFCGVYFIFFIDLAWRAWQVLVQKFLGALQWNHTLVLGQQVA